ncbi:polyphosphate kinase 1 [Thermospira aquatica]|uniref:Polyphosphate kinase n=1 Tax=Thermospira aquatica TaxID=2828656 RepID=A0AAX3BCB1_9SPIR|nr:polyphosphate kinase 1 [Thermospira aquatica]URA09929.1 polyphosphate kinase 1 [Thermospira aquatica]
MKFPWIQRDYSWLKFNSRVLFEATDPFNPLLERLKFLAIVTSNLEEFFMIRVAVLKRQCATHTPIGPLAEDPENVLHTIVKEVKTMLKKQYQIFEKLWDELKKKNIHILIHQEDILPYENELKDIFEKQLYPLLTPLSVSKTHPFPTLKSGMLYLVVELAASPSHKLAEKPSLSFLELPTASVPRFYEVHPNVFIPIEFIIERFLDFIYPGYTIQKCGVVRITRDADYEHQVDGALDIITSVEQNIKHFHKREVVKLEVSQGLSEKTIKTLITHHNLSRELVFEIPSLLNLKDLMGIYEKSSFHDLKIHPFAPLLPESLTTHKNIFSLISNEDILLFHPYQSYDPVLWLLEAAATDPHVIAIKQTLYRTSSDSKIIQYLTLAAENGKYVSVVDELTARFDEKRNIAWARHLQDAGVHVTYGIAHLKTHAKALLIVRKEPQGIRRYVHLATGNYNETTARLYSDFSFFSANPELCEDVNQMFNLLTGFSLPQSWKKIAIAPLTMKQKFLSLIRRETLHARSGLRAEIRAKMNSLADEDIIQALYEASQAGVKIELIIRGICCLIPGIKGISENITVKSIIGRYLEHSRIYYFFNNGEEEYYLSSADWMRRNLDRRIEILFPIENKNIQQIIKTIFDIQIQDTANSWILQANTSYTEPGIRDPKQQRDSFQDIYNYLSQFSKTPKKL